MTDPQGATDSWVPLPRSRQSKPNTQAALVALNFRVPFKLRQRLKLEAASRGVTMTNVLEAALKSYLGD